MKSISKERFCVTGEEAFVNEAIVEIAPSVSASSALFWGLTLVMEASVWGAFPHGSLVKLRKDVH